MRMKTVAQALSWTRIGLGLAFVAAPGPLVRFWTATERPGPETDMMARGLGARDALIGAGGLLALRRGQPAACWLAAGAVADAADAALTLGMLARQPKAPRLALVGVTISSALAFAWMARLVA
jgi:hypothetical protein